MPSDADPDLPVAELIEVPPAQGNGEAAPPPEEARPVAEARPVEPPEEPRAVAAREAGTDIERQIERQIQSGTGASDEQPRPHKIPPAILNKVEAVFVEPAGYSRLDRLRTQRLEMRVFLIQGEERSGRSTCAIRLALQLLAQKERRCWFYTPRPRSGLTVAELTERLEAERDTVYVIQDIHQYGLNEKGLGEGFLDIANDKLEKRESYLLLTATPELKPGAVHAATTASWDLEKALELHLQWYESDRGVCSLPPPVARRIRELKTQVLGLVKSPVQIDRFCRRAGDLSPSQALDESILQLARHLNVEDTWRIRQWFSELPDNAKLYALLARLFQGLARPTLEDLYVREMQRLRPQGWALGDFRDPGLEDMLGRLHLERTKEGGLRFESRAYEVEVERQMRNYFHLLGPMLDTITNTVEQAGQPEAQPVRRALGEALARLGMHRPDRLAPLLGRLADAENRALAAVPSYTLEEACNLGRTDEFRFALDLLEGWVPPKPDQPHDANRMMAAAAAFERTHAALVAVAGQADSDRERAGAAADAVARLRDLLGRLAGRYLPFHAAFREAMWHRLPPKVKEDAARDPNLGHSLREFLDHLIDPRGVFLGVLRRAVEGIYRSRAADAVGALCEWLRDPGARPGEGMDPNRVTRWLFAQEIAAGLFRADQDHRQLVPEQSLHLLDLILPLLSAPQQLEDQVQASVDEVMEIVCGWLANPQWREPVHAGLLRAVNRAESDQRHRLSRSLFRSWLKSGSDTARSIAQSILARARALDGTPVSLPGTVCGVLALDATRQAAFNDTARDLGFQLYGWLRPQTELAVGRLGQRAWVSAANEPLSYAALQSDQFSPRLLLPLLEGDPARPESQLPPERLHFVVVLSWGPLLDLQDVSESPWFDRVLPLQIEGTRLPDDLDTSGLTGPLRSFLDQAMDYGKRHNQLTVETLFKLIEGEVNSRIGRWLAGCPAARYWQALAAELPAGHAGNPAALGDWLDAQLALLDAVPDETDAPRPDRMSMIGSALLGMVAGADGGACEAGMTAAVRLIVRWLKREAGSPDEMRFRAGRALARLLLLVHVSGLRGRLDGGRGRPSLQTHAPLLELAPVLAEHRLWDSLRILLHLVRWCAGDPHWARRLRERREGRPPELVEMVARLPAELHPRLVEALKDWGRPEKELGEQTTSTAQGLADWLRNRLALRDRAGKGGQEEAAAVKGVVIVESAGLSDPMRGRLDRLACELFGTLSKARDDLPVALYRAGQLEPVALTGEELPAGTVLPAGMVPPMRLAGPILEALRGGQIRFVVVLAVTRLLDEDDWAADWRDRGLCVRVGDGPPSGVWETVEAPAARAAEQVAADVLGVLRQRGVLGRDAVKARK